MIGKNYNNFEDLYSIRSLEIELRMTIRSRTRICIFLPTKEGDIKINVGRSMKGPPKITYYGGIYRNNQDKVLLVSKRIERVDSF